MKKVSLIIALVLTTQLACGCSLINKYKSKLNTQPAQAQTTTMKSDSSNDTNSNSSNDSSSTNTDNSSTPQNNTNNNSASSVINNQFNINKKDILKYSAMTKTNLIKLLGQNYKSEGSTLIFSNGLSFFGLSKAQSKPSSIRGTDSVTIMGIKNGMSFKKVQSILGKTNIIETYIGTKTNKAYKIQYSLGKDLLKAISMNKDGSNSYIEIVIK